MMMHQWLGADEMPCFKIAGILTKCILNIGPLFYESDYYSPKAVVFIGKSMFVFFAWNALLKFDPTNPLPFVYLAYRTANSWTTQLSTHFKCGMEAETVV